MSDTHTPGPWHMGTDGNFRVYGPDNRGDDSGLIASVYKGRANARLIAAAPELLGEHRAWAEMFGEALLLALQGDYSKVDELAAVACFHFPNGSPALNSAAIAKAEGREL